MLKLTYASDIKDVFLKAPSTGIARLSVFKGKKSCVTEKETDNLAREMPGSLSNSYTGERKGLYTAR